MSRDIKLVAFDLDGSTLPMMGTVILPKFVEAVESAATNGVIFAVFTGRSLTTIPEQAMLLPAVTYLSHSNGGAVIEKSSGNVIYHSPMDRQLVLNVLAQLEPYKEVVVQLFSNGTVVYPRYVLENFDQHSLPSHHIEAVSRGLALGVDSLSAYAALPDTQVDKVNIMRIEGALREQVIAALGKLPGLDIVSSGGVNLEFNSSCTNKGFALKFLAEHLGLDREQVMAIGDNDNDVGMLSYAGLGVALGDGSQAARDAADYITLPCEDEGAAYAIDKFIL